MLWPTGMASVITGSIDDGYNGLLGWFWIACVITTIGLVALARAALRERFYSAVMAATGLLYPGDIDRLRHGLSGSSPSRHHLTGHEVLRLGVVADEG